MLVGFLPKPRAGHNRRLVQMDQPPLFPTFGVKTNSYTQIQHKKRAHQHQSIIVNPPGMAQYWLQLRNFGCRREGHVPGRIARNA